MRASKYIESILSSTLSTSNLILICFYILILSYGVMISSFAMGCKNIGARCTEGPEIREIEGYRVFKECWNYEDSFECVYPSQNSCDALREEGCVHIRGDNDLAQKLSSSLDECLVKYKNTDQCLSHKKNYVCYRDTESIEEQQRIDLKNQKLQKKIRCSKGPLCLDGNCFTESSEERSQQSKENMKDMQNALSQISAAQEMGLDQIRDGNSNIVSVFKGEALQCKKNPTLGFRDCCGASPKGWGTSIGLAKCSSDAKAMAERRQAGHCINLGTYCSKKIKGPGCIEKKQTYCCFGGRLQKIIQEQGRASQLGLGFGLAQSPDCRGLTIEELSNLDFDKINFEEFYQDLMNKYKTPNIAKDNARVTDAFKSIQEDFSKKDNNIAQLKDRTDQAHFRNKKFKSEVVDEETDIARNRSHL